MHRNIWALLLLMVANAVSAAQDTNPWSTQDYDFYSGDFNGDGFADVLYVAHSASNPSGLLLSDGVSPTIAGQAWASDYLGIAWSDHAYNVVVGDFNGDGKADIPFYNQAYRPTVTSC